MTLALSHALARAGQLDQAQQKADAAVALSEGGTPADRAAALEAAARIAIDRRDVAAAEKSAQARFDLDGSRALRQFVRGRELLGGGHYEEAHAALLEAARSDDEGGVALPGLHLALGDALVHLEQPADAEAQLREEIRLFPLDPRAYVSLAVLLHSLERDDDAAQVIEALAGGAADARRQQRGGAGLDPRSATASAPTPSAPTPARGSRAIRR